MTVETQDGPLKCLAVSPLWFWMNKPLTLVTGLFQYENGPQFSPGNGQGGRVANYKATVTFEFDDDDLTGMGADSDDAYEALFGELQNRGFSDFWINQIYKEGKPLIADL